jgi:hypothetical protein
MIFSSKETGAPIRTINSKNVLHWIFEINLLEALAEIIGYRIGLFVGMRYSICSIKMR